MILGGWTLGQTDHGNQGSGLQPIAEGIEDASPELDDLNPASEEVDTSRVLDSSLESSEAWYGLTVGDCVLDFYPPSIDLDEIVVLDGVEIVPCTGSH